jgi:adenine-specific DNA-methyltransferase
LKKVPAGCGVYSGLYIIGDKYSYKEICLAILNEEFIKYIKTIGKYKSGGYYSFSSGDLLRYLSFYLNMGGDK